MAGLAKGLAIIEIFGSGVQRLTVAEAARGTSTTRAAARRCLLTLEQLGYVERDERYFTPSPRLRQLGNASDQRASLVASAQPLLDQVRDRLQESCSLAVLDGRDALFIARAEADRIIQTGVKVGARMPAYATAAGKLLLGGLDDDRLQAYLAELDLIPLSPRSITTKAHLLEAIVEAHATGVSFSDEELELGMRAMAVPVYRQGRVVAAIGLSTLTIRATIADMAKHFRPVMRVAADELERALARI
jgi:IclR family pca regulon transcriptional regulator